MPKLWSYSQNPAAYIPDPGVRSGVCMVMTYYVVKRFLSGLETTPDILNDKMGLFTSMQRAGQWDVKLSSPQWIKMLGRRDNLKVEIIGEADDFGAAAQLGQEALDRVTTGNAAAYLCLYWKGSGHAIALIESLSGQYAFDPNLGLYELDDAGMEQLGEDFQSMYTDPGTIDTVVISGIPRDLQFLAQD
jgi:hypothetical protein